MSIELDKKRQNFLDADGHLLVLGGPGTGKTTVALLKAKTLFPNLLPGQKLLFLSFSRDAVRQVLAGCRGILTAEERGAIEVKTYHAFCKEFLKTHGKLLTGKAVSVIFPTDERLAKARFDGDWEAERQRLATEEACYCFDFLASGVADLLQRSTALCDLLANSYPTVIVDEFQDTHDEQWRIVQAFASVTRVICLADRDQRIFDYRDDIDPHRIESLHDTLSPQTFDLREENYRSPRGGILDFANAVLNNISPLPKVDDVRVISYWPNVFASTVHAAVLWKLSKLRREGIDNPCVAVLARSNPMVAEIANILSEPHQFNGRYLSPIDYDVVWDAELSAASAAVVASIMEWSNKDVTTPVADSLDAIAHFYELKYASSPSQSAEKNIRKFQAAAKKIRNTGTPRIQAGKELLAAFEEGLHFTGDPVVDWLKARKLLYDIAHLNELFRQARLVRFFRATDALGSGIADLWLRTGHYGGAVSLVTKTIEYERLISANQESTGCILMTMHKSKGKEFDGVVIVEGRYSGVFFEPNREKAPFEKTRRLLRVAITRAKQNVTIIRPNQALPLTG